MSAVPAAPKLRLVAMVRQSFTAMTPVERRRVSLMFASILALHVLGFGIFIAFVIPAHYRGLGIGVSVLAYTLGLRHAFDADHIAVIDNTTRKEMNERQGTGRPRPFCFGYFFSLGHSTVVVAMGAGIVIAEKVVFNEVLHANSGLQQFGTVIGTLVSAGFLFLIGGLNLVILSGIVKVFRAMRRGEYDEAELERQLDNRGFFYRFFGRWMRAISKEWQLYPVGFLFGLGFDTATEVGLLGISATQASQGLSIWSIMVFPALFTAGMTLIDTTDSILMLGAYGWAFVKPIRKLYYNLTITAVSVVVAVVVGGLEALNLIGYQLGLTDGGGFWGAIGSLNDNFGVLGYLIVGIFIVAWLVSYVVYRINGYDKIEATAA